MFCAQVTVKSVSSSEPIITFWTPIASLRPNMFGLNVISDIGGLGLESTDQTLPFAATKMGHHGINTF